ncbi:enoyl-CoA hydratase/isomerase family protein [Peribacillus tepidiphilus]|uniref:enoyl-CoA hydratase/isomerase family protein n=1 Tax=Peribacillus tepidiphilus TaxID=2652445 RepID=UPI0012922656|nr:enoyl-CoA hydratase/isomerase family protein [Peribacillus tepidiphilus]
MAVLKRKMENGLFTLQFNRPEKRNAINFAIMDELNQSLSEAAENDQIKVVMIRGSGDKAFCSGGDLSEFHALKTEEEAWEMLSKMGGILYKLLTLPKPTIAFINGTAVGGGCEIAAACDFRWMKKEAKFGFVQGNQAITTGWGGGTILFEKLLPYTVLEMLSSARIYSAKEGFELGYINKIIEIESVESALEDFLSKEVDVLMAYKKMLIRKWEQTQLRERIIEEIKTCSKLWESEAHHAAVRRFITKI